MYESKWLKASKALDYHIYGGPWARTHAESEYQLYHAVVDLEVLSRIDGKLISDTGFIRGRSFSDEGRYVLPFNLEVNMDDVRRVWDVEKYDLADLIARGLVSPEKAQIQLETVNENLAVLFQSVDSRLAAMPLEQALEETRFQERFSEHQRIHRLLAGANLLPKAKLAELIGEFNSFQSGKDIWLGRKPKVEVEKRRGGPKPRYDWAAVRRHLKKLFKDNGPLSQDDPSWRSQADVERAMQEFCQHRFGREPASSTVREKARSFIEEIQIELYPKRRE